MPLNIRFLYFSSCPNSQKALDLLEEVLISKKVSYNLEKIEVREDEAEKYRFLGSPTIQIEGEDIEPDKRGAPPFYGCRLYKNEKGELSGIPSRKMIEKAIEEAIKK